MSGMPMISNDLRSSCRALLLQSYNKGGDGGKYDSVYHDILENIVPIIEHFDLGGGFTWTIGEWISDIGIGGGRYEIYENGVMGNIQGVDYKEKNVMQLNTFRREFYQVGIIYKDNEPMYATIIGEAPSYSAHDAWGLWTIYYDGNDNTMYRNVIFKQRGDHKIDSITDVSYTTFEPRLYTPAIVRPDGTRETFIAGFDMYFNNDLTYTCTKSYQDYTASAPDKFSEPVVKKAGERTSYTGKYTLRTPYPFPRIYGGFSDLDGNTWFNVMQELSYAILDKAGAKTVPLEIIQPTD